MLDQLHQIIKRLITDNNDNDDDDVLCLVLLILFGYYFSLDTKLKVIPFSAKCNLCTLVAAFILQDCIKKYLNATVKIRLCRLNVCF